MPSNKPSAFQAVSSRDEVVSAPFDDELEKCQNSSKIRDTILSPQMSNLVNYEGIKRWILAKK